MPRQFYLTADPPPITPAVWRGNWNVTTDAVTRRLDSTKTTADPAMYTIQAVSGPETSPTDLYRVALLRYVSGPLLAQTISGTMQLVVGTLESDAAAGMHYAIHAWVSVGDTGALRGTFINNFYETVESLNEWPTEPKGRDLILSAAIDAMNVQQDDRLVIEIGYVARNTTAAPMVGTLYYGTDYYSNGSPDMARDV